ncbi:5-oxoprolinase subunit B family protein [Pseudooctadecabacter jejudonensis]|nr:allophanate hydrolase subunit 1 [Pseudooctadecabacter jejudonensis]
MPTCTPVADYGVLVTFADMFEAGAHARIRALDQALSHAPIEGVTEWVPALVNLMVVFDPLQTDHGAVTQAVEHLLLEADVAPTSGQTCVIDVCYDAPFAPDLAAVAKTTGMSRDGVINAHLSGDYDVLMFGFAPGYGYLGGVPDAIYVPRKSAAVPGVPAGAVMIADRQCLVTTLTMPTGWSVIGRSPTQILTGAADAPTAFQVGDRVQFNRISADDMARQGVTP